MSKSNALILILIFSLLILSCSNKITGWKGTIEEEDGVIVVNNPNEPMYEADVFSLEEELLIGEIEGKEENLFSQVRGLAIDDIERI